MNRPDEARRLGLPGTILTALAGLGGFCLALYSFIQLRTAWVDGVFVFANRGKASIDLEYDSEPLSYIVAMAALYPTAIVCGAGIAIVCAAVLYQQRPGSDTRERSRLR